MYKALFLELPVGDRQSSLEEINKGFLQCFDLVTGSVENPVYMPGMRIKLPCSPGIQLNAQFLRSDLAMKIRQLRR